MILFFNVCPFKMKKTFHFKNKHSSHLTHLFWQVPVSVQQDGKGSHVNSHVREGTTESTVNHPASVVMADRAIT